MWDWNANFSDQNIKFWAETLFILSGDIYLTSPSRINLGPQCCPNYKWKVSENSVILILLLWTYLYVFNICIPLSVNCYSSFIHLKNWDVNLLLNCRNCIYYGISSLPNMIEITFLDCQLTFKIKSFLFSFFSILLSFLPFLSSSFLFFLKPFLL